MKQIVSRHDCAALAQLVTMGRAKVVKEHTPDGPVYAAYSATGMPLGVIGDRWKYLFETALIQQGAGDGLFEGCSQTVRAG